MSVLCLWLSLPPSSWLLTKASAPTLHACINLPISSSPWGEGQEEQAKGRCPSSMKEGDFKPERPGQAEAKNFSLTRRAGYLVWVGGGQVATSLELQSPQEQLPAAPLQCEVPFGVLAPSASRPGGEAGQLSTLRHCLPRGHGPR